MNRVIYAECLYEEAGGLLLDRIAKSWGKEGRLFAGDRYCLLVYFVTYQGEAVRPIDTTYTDYSNSMLLYLGNFAHSIG